MATAGNAHLNSEGGRITYWFELLLRINLLGISCISACNIFFHFLNNVVQTSKDRKSAVCDTSLFRIEVSISWLHAKIKMSSGFEPLTCP